MGQGSSGCRAGSHAIMSFKDHESKVDSQFLDGKIHVLGVLIRTEGHARTQPLPICRRPTTSDIGAHRGRLFVVARQLSRPCLYSAAHRSSRGSQSHCFRGPLNAIFPVARGPHWGGQRWGWLRLLFTTAYRTLTSAVWICRGRDAPPQTKSTTWNPRRSVATRVHAHTLSPSFSCFSFQYSDSMAALLAKSIGPQQNWQVLTFVAVRKVTKRADLV